MQFFVEKTIIGRPRTKWINYWPKYFCKVAETGSFTAAATAFSVPPSSISRRISDLETNLGTHLLTRSTRAVKLTEIGTAYLEQVKEILVQLELSNESVKSYQSSPMGQLKVSSMVSFGERKLFPLLDDFSALYPDITLDISLSDESHHSPMTTSTLPSEVATHPMSGYTRSN